MGIPSLGWQQCTYLAFPLRQHTIVSTAPHMSKIEVFIFFWRTVPPPVSAIWDKTVPSFLLFLPLTPEPWSSWMTPPTHQTAPKPSPDLSTHLLSTFPISHLLSVSTALTWSTSSWGCHFFLMVPLFTGSCQSMLWGIQELGHTYD